MYLTSGAQNNYILIKALIVGSYVRHRESGRPMLTRCSVACQIYSLRLRPHEVTCLIPAVLTGCGWRETIRPARCVEWTALSFRMNTTWYSNGTVNLVPA